jgi:phage gp46-like protein
MGLNEVRSLVDMSDLEAAAVLSIRSQKRYGNSEGYWADALDSNIFGSHLWRLQRSILNQETLTLAEYYVQESLTWLLDKGLADRIDVKGQVVRDRLILQIQVGREEIRYVL